MAQSSPKKRTGFIHAWEETERHWGIRPDGFSLHLSESDYKQFVKEYWDSMPDSAPEIYYRPAFGAELQEVVLPERIYQRLQEVTGLRDHELSAGE